MEVNLNGEMIIVGNEEDFTIDEMNLEGNLCQVGALLRFYGSLSADLKAQASNKKSHVEEYDAEYSLRVRVTEDKVTEGLVREKVKADPTHKKKMEEYIIAERDHQKVENLYKSQIKRADVLISLAYSKRQEIKNY